jgi:hypothetical protein
MERPLILTAATLLALSTMSPANAKGEPPGNAAQAMAAAQNAQRAQQMQAQNQQRQSQMQQMEREQAQARSNQEQAMKAQEEQARGAQMNAIRMQQSEAKQAQEQMRQQAQMQKGQQDQQRNQAAQMQKQQEQQRNQAAQMQKEQQEQQRNQAAQMQKEQQEQQRNQAAQMQKEQGQQRNQSAQMQKEQQEQQRNQAAQMQREQEHNRQPNQVVGNMNERMPGAQRQPGESAQQAAQQAEQREGREERGGTQIAAQGQHMNPGASFVRAAKPRAITAGVIPTAKAVSMPVLEPGATAQEQQHAAAATKNLQRHLIAVPANQAPQNGAGIRNSTVNNYFNNYRATVNNRQISINRQNTNFYNVPPTQFPQWWQPDAGWTYSNGFTIGSLPCNSDWLGYGWHPYWGPPPDGFVCESDYVPTPWFYIPAAGLWRQPGVMGYADYGPPYDYEGPITVEVMEPRHVHVRDPFTGWTNDRVINVVYFYNAYYYPEFERYGYMNRHGYFIWLNFDDSDADSGE